MSDTKPTQKEGQDTDSSLQRTIAFTIALSSIITVDTFKANKLADEIAEALNQSPKGVTISRDSAEYTYNQLEDGGSIYRDHDKASKLLGELESGLFDQHTGEQK